jgi:DNA-binding Lrp family transcriptional regulator
LTSGPARLDRARSSARRAVARGETSMCAGGPTCENARDAETASLSMTHAVVLIEAARNALSALGGELADLEGVAEAYSVTGEWDFVAIVRVPDHEQLADVVTGGISGLPGVTRTQTMVAFAAFSRHDLESLFSIGE